MLRLLRTVPCSQCEDADADARRTRLKLLRLSPVSEILMLYVVLVHVRVLPVLSFSGAGLGPADRQQEPGLEHAEDRSRAAELSGRAGADGKSGHEALRHQH